ncbi:E3 ubiquitin-protein ligase RNF19B-like isoform X1 [Melanotaenia boesemani]|uniref:E3 ubiquitin-protein ligase RNF19B-like isoform X1 n=1 Tax=Melanotaenia boesemani TaxID=1250792 RepID=UPI001C03FBB7|nr:E3 ubiquitin-protein ligase RNF19B-like isoform X1 [Melanotaenia boesemani]XP_041840516.1 E3 ubiquitin-protein ligase RNF19B-like isoform X1 [Melanotaenia boesemani]
MGSNASTKQEKCYDPGDPTLKFVDEEDCLDFLYEGFSSRRAQMSCGHAVTPTSLTNWCMKLLEDGGSRFVCGQFGCNAEWSYAEVCKMALLTAKEKEYFEKTMALNAVETTSCPRCKSSVVRHNTFNLRVCCNVCRAKTGRIYAFCWQCMREWKGPQPRSDHCENDGCNNLSLQTLRSCPDINFTCVKGVTGCPSIRACPTCGCLLEHLNTNCKHLLCPQCKVKFCFVCLKIYTECMKTSSICAPCSTGVAPRQISIPVWKK